MEVLRYESAMLSEITSSYNNLINGQPHCYPVSVEDFESAVSGVEKEQLCSEEAFVVREGPAVLGFAHIGIDGPRKAEAGKQGIIRFLWYERGHRPAGQTLLDFVEEYFHQRSLTRVKAFHQDYRYPIYHLDHTYLSDRLNHIHGLLGLNGYSRIAGEVYLDWPDYDPATPSLADVSADVSAEFEEGHGKLPGLIIRAHQGKKEIGSCHSVSCGEFSHADDAQYWIFTTGLGVSPGMQGKGLGRYLLQRALQEAKSIGYRHAVISANWKNYRAHVFYGNYGYHVADWTYALAKNLQQ
ncbi:GNAT family N-acetyltransferase [Candidatus Poribacteria bacterium]